jgi:hypothetical protein
MGPEPLECAPKATGGGEVEGGTGPRRTSRRVCNRVRADGSASYVGLLRFDGEPEEKLHLVLTGVQEWIFPRVGCPARIPNSGKNPQEPSLELAAHTDSGAVPGPVYQGGWDLI